MAAKNVNNKISFNKKAKVCRPGVHSKCKSSNHKHSKHYLKKNKGQG